MKFGNLEFILAMTGPKLDGRGVGNRLIKHKIGDNIHPWGKKQGLWEDEQGG